MNLDKEFDDILILIYKNFSIEKLKSFKGTYFELQKVKKWQNKNGYELHVYSNDHLIDNEPHFHLIKRSEKFDCKILFTVECTNCKGDNKISRRIRNALDVFLFREENIKILYSMWNEKNPTLKKI